LPVPSAIALDALETIAETSGKNWSPSHGFVDDRTHYRKAARIVKVWEEFNTRRRINLFLHPLLPLWEQAGNWYDCLHRSRGGPERAGKDASEDPDYFFVRSSPRILFVRQVSSRETLGTLCQFLVVLIVLTLH